MCFSIGFPVEESAAAGGETSALSEEAVPLFEPEDLPERTAPILEIGPDFLGTGNIPRGFELPTGAVWTPSLWVFGNYRTAVNFLDRAGADTQAEWVNRLDLFANLQLTGTERLLIGMSPLNDGGQFVGNTFRPDSQEGWMNEGFNTELTTFFFEGEFGEIFPNLDPEDTGSYDYGFSIGRQPIFFQEGMMFNDTIDSIGITRDTVIVPDISVDTRVTGLFGWGNVNRGDTVRTGDTYVAGLFTETDFRATTTNLDVAYVFADDADGGDGFFAGASATQRIGLWNTSFRANLSVAVDDSSPAVGTGGLLFTEISRTLPYGDDVVYGNGFWGIDEFTSAARDRTTGGPLGRVGLLFSGVGLGVYGSPLSNQAQNVAGGAVGYQWFLNNHRTQFIFEAGGRYGTDEGIEDSGGLAVRFQQAIGRRVVLQADTFVAQKEGNNQDYGARMELLVRF